MSSTSSRLRRPEGDPDPSSLPEVSGAGRQRVTEIMSHPVFALTPDRVLDEALDALVRFGIRHLAVVDRDGRCLGIISDRMIVSEWAHNMACLGVRQVRDLVAPDPAVVHSQATVAEVARVMARLRVDAVAVTERDGRLIGIVTGSDLVALLSRDG